MTSQRRAEACRTLGLALLLGCWVFAACSFRELVPSALMLTMHDLPEGWSHDRGVSMPKVAGADARADTFHYRQQGPNWLVITHELVVYPDQAGAVAAFTQWESDWFPAVGHWDLPSNSTFVPTNGNDLYRLGCSDRVIEGTSACTLLQEHGRFLSLVLANLDPQALTFGQFEQALRRVDQRFQTWDATITSTP